MINYTDVDIPYTRIIEHNHFDYKKIDSTWITYEYPIEYTEISEPLYPVNDVENTEKYKKYKSLADELPNVHFGGRLAEYKYYDMHNIIENALSYINSKF
jgi:UDP-galactopyranose mutase